MKFFLLLIILCMGGGGYYEYTTMQQQLSDQDDQIKKLQADNTDLKQKMSDLAKAGATAPGTTAVTTPPAPDAPAAPMSPVAPGAGWTNLLGTVSTADGKTYATCRLIKVKPTGIVVNDADGITEIGFMVMPANLQQKFGYDPKAGANLPDDVVQADEGLRQASKD